MEDCGANFGDADTTLMAWRGRFINAARPVAGRIITKALLNMFLYYLNACAGAFRARDINWRVVFTRGVENGLRVPR